MRALIVEEGSTTAALAGVRALAQAGWEVGIGSPQPRGLAASSRFTARWHRVPATSSGIESFISAVNSAAMETPYDLVFPAGDAEQLALSWARDRLLPKVPFASHETVVSALDKLTFAEAAAVAGIAVPWTVPATDEALASIDGPTMVKARLHSHPEAEETSTRLEAKPVPDQVHAAERVAEIRRQGGEPLLQELVPGRLIVYTALTNTDGEIITRLQHVAKRIYPPGAGPTCRGHTVAIDWELDSKVANLLRDMGWFGMAQLQLLQLDGKEPQAIDFNGRFFATMQIALAAGINFPAAWASLAMGKPARVPKEGAVGIRFQDLERDLQRARIERRHGQLVDVFDCIKSSPGACHPIWSPHDVKPGLYALGRIGCRIPYVRRLSRPSDGASSMVS